MGRKDWSDIATYEEFLAALQKHSITYKKLDSVVFGPTAVKVIACIRKDKQYGLDMLKKSGAVWYMATVALEEVVKPLNTSHGPDYTDTAGAVH